MAKHVGPTVKVNEHSEEKGSVDLIEIIYDNLLRLKCIKE